MKKMKFFAMAFAAIVAVAFSACNQNQPTNPGGGNNNEGNDTTTTENVIKVQLSTMEAFWIQEIEGIEQYQLQSSIKDGNKNVTYIMSIGAYTSDKAGLVDGTYNLAASDEQELKAETIYGITKQTIEGNDTTEVTAEQAALNVTIEGDNVNYKFNVSFADGVKEEITYNGKAPEVIDANGLWEPETPSEITINADACGYGIIYLGDYYADADYSQIELILINQTTQDEAYFTGILSSTANKTATELPVGEFAITNDLYIGDDGFFPGTYFDQYPYVYVSSTNGMYWPQSGSVIIANNEGTYTITISVLSYYGSNITINYTGEVVNVYEEASYAPLKKAPQKTTQPRKSILSNVKPVRFVK